MKTAVDEQLRADDSQRFYECLDDCHFIVQNRSSDARIRPSLVLQMDVAISILMQWPPRIYGTTAGLTAKIARTVKAMPPPTARGRAKYRFQSASARR